MQESGQRRPDPGASARLWRSGNTCLTATRRGAWHEDRESAIIPEGESREEFLEFTIAAVNPLDHADAIKQLFLDHERPEFPAFFDRAYPAGVKGGGVSWIGRDRAGHIVMHVACFPQRFRFGEREVVGGLMVNALVARRFRSFFPAHALIKRAKKDTEARGDIDFLYTDPNNQAKAVMDACGFVMVGSLTRYVLAVGDRRWLVDGAIQLLHAGVRVVRRTPRGAVLAAHPATEFSPARFEAPTGASPRLRAYHGPARYAARLEAYPTESDWWFTHQENGDPDAFAAGLLVRGPDPAGVAVLHAIRRDARVPLGALVPGLVAALRSKGCRRLQVWTLAESLFAEELRRVGFAARDDAAPIVATGLTPAGQDVLRSAPLWEITSLECDR